MAELTPQPVPRPSETPVVKALTPLPTILSEQGGMMPTPNVSPGLEKLVDQATADLAERLNIDTAEIKVVEAKAVVWPDGALGCPDPGVAYTQVQREGALIRLLVGKRVYQYHSGGGRLPFLCENPSVPEDVPPSPGWGID
jgi:hypothetical protein